MGRVTGFLAVSIGDKGRIVTAAVLLLVVRLSFVVVSFAAFRRRLLALSSSLSRIVPGSPPPVRVAWAVEVTDRTIPGHRTCLMRSLTSEAIHSAYGHDVVHRIGVDPDGPGDEHAVDTSDDGDHTTGSAGDEIDIDRPGGGEFEAHSWIEHDGTVILGDLEDLSRFEPLPPLADPGEP
ncbi:lasso peptide biosynthesis B2 protein [Natrarchaeobius chitinivorans]|uniref:Lasso peptide biosynthesis B2 protein n=1 Tax=Natrarchaeobius chitinivorans TaxID=1679083 RepID=A0A3N6LTY6_NATCH|nr:lasso peptide biosynthesis B2 protein [Natrarchaeobius chitinivorans]RQG90974.1 lasso peptide biosynthesis B2 protein [Natrarchaeobius chitinivorans]